MKKYRFIFIISLLSVALLCSCAKNDKTATQEKVIPVKVVEIAVSQIATDGRMYVGTVEESVAVSLSFSNMGTVEQVFVQEGQKVRKGQLLATLNTTTMQNSYDASLAKLAQAQDAYDRLAKVHANGSLPDIKFAEVEAGLQQAKSMTAISKKSLDDCRLYATQNGVIAVRNIEPGESAIPGSSAFKLVSVDMVNVKISVPENEIGAIQAGQKAAVTVPALNNAVFSGKIEMKGVAANAMSHTYEAKIGIGNPQSALLPGMICKVNLESDSFAEITVPNRSVQIMPDGKRFVWLADGNVARRRPVKTGDLASSGIIVVEGLSTGDKVIVEGFQKISEGMSISIKD